MQKLFAGGRKSHVVEHQKIIANHKEQMSQVNDVNAFQCMGRCKNLGSLKLFPRSAS